MDGARDVRLAHITMLGDSDYLSHMLHALSREQAPHESGSPRCFVEGIVWEVRCGWTVLSLCIICWRGCK
jgi:hypothetical protein